MKRVVFAIIVAVLLWAVMFLPITAPYVNFWLVMTIAAVVLTTLSTCFMPSVWKGIKFSIKDILLGVGIAVVLWGVFWVGDKLSQLMFDFARPEVDAVYGIKEGVSPLLLSLLLLFVIGPAEEIFWRGYVQESFARRWNGNKAFIVTTAIYTLVHVPSLNFMLVMAAMVAGATWGLLYRFFPQRFTAIVVSHAIWDAAVFVWFPIM